MYHRNVRLPHLKQDGMPGAEKGKRKVKQNAKLFQAVNVFPTL